MALCGLVDNGMFLVCVSLALYYHCLMEVAVLELGIGQVEHWSDLAGFRFVR